MLNKDKLNLCLNWIRDDKIMEWTKDWLQDQTPDYFWEIPASSTGKYHPNYTTKKGGLVLHTKAVFQIALDQLDNKVWSFDKKERDIILSAILLHDTRKLGMPKEKYTVSNHAVLVADAIRKECKSGSVRARIADAISTHMGQWNKDFKTDETIAPLPSTELQFFVHLCDYLASRKYMEINWERVKV